MGLFETNPNDEIALLRAEVERLKAGQPQQPSKSAEAERIGVHSSDPHRTFAQWMSYRKRVGDTIYRSRKVQELVQRDFAAMGRERFYGED